MRQRCVKLVIWGGLMTLCALSGCAHDLFNAQAARPNQLASSGDPRDDVASPDVSSDAFGDAEPAPNNEPNNGPPTPPLPSNRPIAPIPPGASPFAPELPAPAGVHEPPLMQPNGGAVLEEIEGAIDKDGLITLHMDDVDVRKALEMLSRQGKINILVSPNVGGLVTLDLNKVTIDEALTSVLDLCNLVAKRQNGIVYVYTAEELNRRSMRDHQDLPMRIYHLNYIKGFDLQRMIKPILSNKGCMSATPISDIGIKADSARVGGDSLAGGETVVVQDYEAVLKNVDRLVMELDVQPFQVLIEAVLISVTLDHNNELGVNFGVLGGNTLTVVGSGAAINAAAGFVPAQMLEAGKLVGDATSGFAEANHGLKFGFVDQDVTGFVRALSTIGHTKILATPRVLVLNKQRAEIQLGQRLGYRTLTQTQTSTVQKVEFMNVGTQLRLRPFIATDGMIRMEIHPERSSGKVVDNVPQTVTAEVTSNVMVPDGSTIVIGGLMDEEDIFLQQGVPGLSQIPYVGALFRYRQASKVQKELIVLITPHIWRSNADPTEWPKCSPAAMGLKKMTWK